MANTHNLTNVFPTTALAGDTFTIGPSQSANVDLDLSDIENIQLLTFVTYASSGASTGVTLNLHGGFGDNDPAALTSGGVSVVYNNGSGSSVPTFSDNAETVTMVTVTPLLTTSQTKKTSFYLSDCSVKWPQWIRLRFSNTDSINSAQVRIIGDL